MNISLEFVPIWQPTSSWDALSGFLRCTAARHRAFIGVDQLAVTLKVSETDPDGTSIRRKWDHAEQDGRSGSLFKDLLFESSLCVSSFTVQASQAVS